MNNEELLETIRDLERIKDPEVCNLLRGELNGYLSHLEENEWEQRLEVSRKKKELLAELKKVNQVEIEIEFTEEFSNWEKTKRRLNEVKRLRADLGARYEVLVSKKRYY